MPALAGFAQVYAAFLPQLLIAYAFLDRAMTPRWGAALRVTQAAVAVLLVLPVGDTSTVGTALFVGVVMPLVFYKDDVRFRLLVAALLTVVTSVSEFSGIAFWMIATGRAESNSVVESLAHYPAHVASSLLCAAVSALALWVFLRQLAVVRARLHGRELTLVGFLVLQAASINLFGKAIMLGSPDDAPLFWGAAILGLLCLAADVEVLRAVGRLRLRELEARRVARMSRAVEELSAGARREMGALEEVAMLRHDARNHLQVLTSLIERGQRGEAASYARALSAALSSRGEKNVVTGGAPGDVGSEP